MLSCTGIRLAAFWRKRPKSIAATTLGLFSGAILSGQAARADWRATLAPLLAQESAAEGGYAIIEWAIVVVLIGAALFVICRSSRRN
jgi:hypothetical protein